MQLLVLTSLAAGNIKWQFKSREIRYAIQSYGPQKEFSCL